MTSSADSPDREPLPPHRDPATWAPMIEQFAPAMLVVIASLMGERVKRHLTPEDIWQDVLLMAWRDRDRHEWRGSRSYRSWLLTVARNRICNIVDSIETKRRGGDRAIDPFSVLTTRDDSISNLLPPGSTTPTKVASRRETARAMDAALKTVPDPLQRIVRLRLFEDIPMQEVAASLGLPLSTAKDRFLKGATLYRRALGRVLDRSSLTAAQRTAARSALPEPAAQSGSVPNPNEDEPS